jgi:hypothetical protein
MASSPLANVKSIGQMLGRERAAGVAHRVQFTAPMPVPGREDGDGVDAMSLDERIITLRAAARWGMCSFRLEAHAVAEPSG